MKTAKIETKIGCIWNEVCTTDPAHTKEVSYGGRSFTTIVAHSQIARATALWGDYGKSWGVKDLKYEVIRGENNTPLLTTLDAEFFCPLTKFIIGTDINFLDSKGRVVEDQRKKLLTDLTTKALSKIGFNADVFMSLFDDNKYVAAMEIEMEKGSSDRIKIEQEILKLAQTTTLKKEPIDRMKTALPFMSRPVLEQTLKSMKNSQPVKLAKSPVSKKGKTTKDIVKELKKDNPKVFIEKPGDIPPPKKKV